MSEKYATKKACVDNEHEALCNKVLTIIAMVQQLSALADTRQKGSLSQNN